jgi:ATP phosphoribosyltransferase
VGADRLEELLEFVPAMKSPTISELSAGGYAVETVVDRKDVNRLIPLLKQHGAADILELPISKIVP